MYQRIVNCLCLMVLLSGCATKRENMKIPQAVLEKPTAIVITQISGLEEPTYYKSGSQGLLDLAVNDLITDSMQDKIKEIDAASVTENQYYQPMGKNFDDRSFKVTRITAPLDREKLRPAPVDEAQYAPYDFRFLKNKHGVEWALILDPHAFGVERSYYSIVPTGAPTGFANISVYLVNLKDNSIAGLYKASVNEAVEGEWDAPPEYLVLTAASKKALGKALHNAHTHLFHKISR